MKKLMILILCVAMFSGVVFAKSVSVSKHEAYKEQLGIGIDILNSEASLRFWFSEGLGMDISTNMQALKDSIEFGLGAGLVVPMFKTEDIFLNLIPAVKLEVLNTQVETSYGPVLTPTVGFNVYTTIGFLIGAQLEFEVFLSPISRNLSISSGVGLALGVVMESVNFLNPAVDDTSENSVMFTMLKDDAVASLIIRYYF